MQIIGPPRGKLTKLQKTILSRRLALKARDEQTRQARESERTLDGYPPARLDDVVQQQRREIATLKAVAAAAKGELSLVNRQTARLVARLGLEPDDSVVVPGGFLVGCFPSVQVS